MTGVGTISVPAETEPAGVVLRFARESLRRGTPGLDDRDALQQILDYFCTRRACKTALPETLTINNFAAMGGLKVEPWVEPAEAIEACSTTSEEPPTSSFHLVFQSDFESGDSSLELHSGVRSFKQIILES